MAIIVPNIKLTTDAQIKAAYENNADTNAYTDSEKVQVSTVESLITGVKTTGYTAEAFEKVIMDNSVTTATLNLPTSPTDGQWVEVDSVGLYSLFAVYVSGGTNDIMVGADTLCELNGDNTIYRFWWDNANSLWKIRIVSSNGRVS